MLIITVNCLQLRGENLFQSKKKESSPESRGVVDAERFPKSKSKDDKIKILDMALFKALNEYLYRGTKPIANFDSMHMRRLRNIADELFVDTPGSG